MKIMVLTIVLVIVGFGCGIKKDDAAPLVDLSTVTIVYQGNILESSYANIFEKTEDCLHDNFGYNYRPPAPELIVLNEMEFMCGNYTHVDGCTDVPNNTIYISKYLYTSRSGFPLNHEVVHWMTGIGNEGHDTAPFSTCAP